MLRRLSAVALALLPSLALPFHDHLACGDCHTPASGALGRPGVVRGGDETALCLGCHDGRREAPAVLHGGGIAGDAGRPAGGLSRLGDRPERTGGYGEATGHTLGSRARPPGFTGAWTGALTCKSCHAVHANGRYRNLGPDPFLTDPAYLAFARIFDPQALPLAEAIGAASPGEVRPGADVLVPDASLAPDPANAPVLAANGGRNAMDRFCASCHTLLHGDGNTRAGGSRGSFVRHPTSGVPLAGATGDALERAVQPPRVSWGDAGAAEVGCLTCHRAHGSRHGFGLVWWDRGAARNGEDGAGASAGSLCLTCHRVDEDEPRVAAGAASRGVKAMTR